MDPLHRTFTQLPDFCAAIQREGIRSVVVRRVHEIRPRALAGHQVEVGEQRWTELAAYRSGTLYTARLEGVEGLVVEAELRAQGLQIRSVVGNLG